MKLILVCRRVFLIDRKSRRQGRETDRIFILQKYFSKKFRV